VTRSWSLPRAGFLLEVRSGSVWATVDGDARDWAVGAGQALVVTGPGRLVVEAFEATELVVRPAPKVAVARAA
jgi:hypothetical protein